MKLNLNPSLLAAELAAAVPDLNGECIENREHVILTAIQRQAEGDKKPEVRPRAVVAAERLRELLDGISSFVDDGKIPPQEWFDEARELVEVVERSQKTSGS